MKNIFLSSFLLLAIVKTSLGQSEITTSSSTGRAKNADVSVLNVRLFPIQTIEVNSSQKAVYLDYRTKANYTDGVELTQPDHLKIYSTGGFSVKVNSNTNLKNQTGSDIPVSDISISTVAGGENPFLSLNPTTITLSNTAQPLIQSNTGGVNKTVSINYKAKGADRYVDRYVNGEDPNIYTTEIVYIIEAI